MKSLGDEIRLGREGTDFLSSAQQISSERREDFIVRGTISLNDRLHKGLSGFRDGRPVPYECPSARRRRGGVSPPAGEHSSPLRVCGFRFVSVGQTLSRGAGGGRTVPLRLPRPPFLLYRQRHIFFSAGRKENVGLKQWVLAVAHRRSQESVPAGRVARPLRAFAGFPTVLLSFDSRLCYNR